MTISRITVDNGDPEEVIPISFNALAQYRLVIDHITESFMITNFMVATRSSTNVAGIKLPPVHGAQKGVDPDLKPESQDKSKKILLKPTIQTPIKSPAPDPCHCKDPSVKTQNSRYCQLSPYSPWQLIKYPYQDKHPSGCTNSSWT